MHPEHCLAGSPQGGAWAVTQLRHIVPSSWISVSSSVDVPDCRTVSEIALQETEWSGNVGKQHGASPSGMIREMVPDKPKGPSELGSGILG